jgi:Helix-turn-helix domain
MDLSKDGLLTEKAAPVIGMAPATMETKRSRGTLGIPHYKIGRRIFYARADLDAFLRRSRVEPAA